MRDYGDFALDDMSCDYGRFPRTAPQLMQYADEFILLGNPLSGTIPGDPSGSVPVNSYGACPVEMVRSGNVCNPAYAGGGIGGGEPAISIVPTQQPGGQTPINVSANPPGTIDNSGPINQNPNVSGGGSGTIPYQPYYQNGGVNDNQTNWNTIIQGVLSPQSTVGNSDPASAMFQTYNDSPAMLPDFNNCNCSNTQTAQGSGSSGTGTGTGGTDYAGNPIGNPAPPPPVFSPPPILPPTQTVGLGTGNAFGGGWNPGGFGSALG